MLDPLVRRLLEDAVNTSGKLALVLLYAEHERLAATPRQLALRLCRDPWSVEAAIRELIIDGVLAERDGRIVFATERGWSPAIKALRHAYEDPFHRDTILQLVRDQERYAPYREELRHRRITVTAC